MSRIIVLDDNLTNMIAAGEVIERPASVAKELLENSIDAGAGRIRLCIEDGGRKLISVTDDGMGMDAEDLTKAFASHATSKIKTNKDLEEISTLGFRGEALASIAAIAKMRAVSRERDSIEANFIEIDCGEKCGTGPCSGDYGTTIEIRDLFYKLPARRKFLRTANTEMSHITEQFTRIALANCQLDLTLEHNGREVYRLMAGQSVRQRISKLFSARVSEELFEVEANEKQIEIFAMAGIPAAARANGKYQYVFLNGRFIRDKFISHAMREAYRGLMEPGKYPVMFLFIKMAADDFDVNVHPTKIEVRFYNSNLVHSQVLGVLREKLLSMNLDVDVAIPITDGSAGTMPPAADGRSSQIADAMAEFFKKHEPARTQHQFSFRSQAGSGTGSGGPEEIREYQPTHIHETQAQQARHGNFLQIHDSFIVEQTENGFVIIDQHALHERIIYEQLCRRITAVEGEGLESQRLLIPESFEITQGQADALEANAELIKKLGIELEDFGPKTIAVQAFPLVLSKVRPAEFVRDMLDLLSERSEGLDAERLLHEVLDMAACKAAIKAGQALGSGEIEQLLADRQIVERASRCPHGRPTTIKFSLAELAKQFKRT